MTFIALATPIFLDVAQYGTIQATLNALPASGGTITIPSGDYTISSALSYTLQTNQHVVLEGIGNVRLISTVAEPGSESGILTFIADSGSTARLTIRNITISHTNSGVGLLNGLEVAPFGSNLTSVANLVLDNVKITGTSLWGCRLFGVQQATILNCTMSSNRDGGLGITGGTNIKVLGGDYSNNVTGAVTGDYGISLTSSSSFPYPQNILIEGVQAKNNGRKGIDVHAGHHVHIIGNDCIGNGYVGIYAVAEDTIKDVGDVLIENNFVDQAGGNVTLQQFGIQVGVFGTPTGISPGVFIVKGNEIRNTDIGLTSSSGIYCFCPTSGPPAEQVVFEGNVVKHGAGSAGQILWLGPGIAVPQAIIKGNTIHAVSCTHEIRVDNATYVLCEGNNILVDSGTPTDGINIVSGAFAIVAHNQLNGAAPTTSIVNTSVATQMTRGNQLNGAIINDGDFTVDQYGHLLALKTGTPTFASVNANVVNNTVTGNDVRGVVQFDVQTGTISASTILFVVTFTQSYTIAPIVVTTTTGNQTAATYYVSAISTTGFTVRCAGALSVLTGYKFNYMVIG